jgi:hypothetical protein
MAEAYWDLEWELQQQGFDLCYDKRLYDRLEHESPESIRLHLCADPGYQERLVRFLENHDEPRAAATFLPSKARAAAIVVSTLQGAVLFHDGQFEGRRTRIPVFLRRRPQEPADESLRDFYKQLLRILRSDDFKHGQWALCERSGWSDNDSYVNLVAWCVTGGGIRHLIAVNLSDRPSQARIRPAASMMEDDLWRMTDEFTGISYERRGAEVMQSGLYVALAPWAFHVLKC